METLDCNNCKIKSVAAKTLTADELHNLKENCVEVNFKKGDIIIKQGAFSSNIIYIKKGLVKIHIKGPYNEQIIKITKAPSYLGIPTTFGDKINQYSATAIENTSVCFIDLKTFKYFVEKNGKFAYKILIELCQNEVSSFNRCANRAQKHIHGRIADALLFFKKDIFVNEEFTIPLSRSELGGFVDTSRESVCRILTEFHTDKIIKLHGRKIKMLDEQRLETIGKNG